MNESCVQVVLGPVLARGGVGGGGVVGSQLAHSSPSIAVATCFVRFGKSEKASLDYRGNEFMGFSQ